MTARSDRGQPAEVEAVERREPNHVTTALDAVVAEESAADAFVTRAGRRAIERAAW